MQDLIQSLTMVIFIILLLIIGLGVGMISFILYLKKEKKGEETSTNLIKVQRENAKKILPIEEIKDDMIIETGGMRFSAIITCTGNDFFTRSRDEQVMIQNQYVEFIFALEEPVSFRQYDEGIREDHAMEKLRTAYHSLERELYHLTEDLREKQLYYAEDKKESGKWFLKETFAQEEKKLLALQWRMEHIESQMKHLLRITNADGKKKRRKMTYVLSWSPDAASSMGLMDTSIYEMGQTELDRMCQVKIRQLSDAGASARRCTTKELIDMIRKHTCPISSERYSIEDVYESAYFDDIVDSDAMERREKEFEDDLVSQILFGGRA